MSEVPVNFAPGFPKSRFRCVTPVFLPVCHGGEIAAKSDIV